MQLYYIQLNLVQLQMDMFKVPQHVEDELQACLKLICRSAIVVISHMPKESIEISSMLVKEENIELLSKSTLLIALFVCAYVRRDLDFRFQDFDGRTDRTSLYVSNGAAQG
jgi:hypothetical protein